MFRKAAAVAFLFAFSGCTLYNEVTVTPLLLTPASLERGSDLQSMLRKADYLRAIEAGRNMDAKQRRNAADLQSLGKAYLAAGRLDDARSHLRAALDLEPFRIMYAEIAWNLSEVEVLSNNFDLALEWAQIAFDRGLQIRRWHIDYLTALSNVPVYRFSGENSQRLQFRFGRPDVPRIETRLNRTVDVEGVVDSGAVLSIISERLAAKLPVKRLGEFEGTFYGLLGEPIRVHFGLLESVELGGIIIENVPVAIMPDDKMRFLISKAEGTQFHMDFLLGTNLLKEFRLELDFDRRSVTFTRLSVADRRPADDQNLFYQGFRPHVRGAVNRKGWFLFVLDTGSEITFLNETQLAALPVQVFGTSHTATLQGLGGAMKRGAKVENVEVGLDRWAGTFKTIPMYASEDKDGAVGIIGQNFLENFNVIIDFGRMRVDLKRR
ncbi:MAG TPA: aspartyl protease family protein [Thermoanaerobaculia bacterium]|nr:aspartyl protease family protein [Thermoanaerobaculia bacterium]